MTTIHPITLTLAAALAAGSAVAQQTGGLFYTTGTLEQSNQCPPGALADVRRNEIQWVEPNATASFSSKAWLPRVSSNVVLGDHDGDGNFDERQQFGGIDALVHPRDKNGARVRIDKTRLFFSPRSGEPTLFGPAFQPADIGRVLPGGFVERFLTAGQVHAAFGIPNNVAVDVDAAALHLTPNGGSVYLSFEGAHAITVAGLGVVVVGDGAIVRIPPAAITWTLSPWDGAAIVDTVVPLSGQLVLAESQVDTRVANSGIRDAAGAAVTTIGDLDGLTLDPQGGTFQSPWINAPIPHLWFCGENLTGAGIVSTAGGGSIPALNGVPLGSPVATDGKQVGLYTTPSVGSLDGLAVSRGGVSHLSLDTADTTIPGPGALRLEIGGAPLPPTLMLDLGCNLPSCIDPFVAALADDFPALYPLNFGPIVPVVGGCGSFVLPVSPAMHLVLQGQTVEFQVWYFDPAAARLHISNPAKVTFQ